MHKMPVLGFESFNCAESKKMKRNCQGHGKSWMDCWYWGEIHIQCPNNYKHTIWVCGNCWHGMYKWYKWKIIKHNAQVAQY